MYFIKFVMIVIYLSDLLLYILLEDSNGFLNLFLIIILKIKYILGWGML